MEHSRLRIVWLCALLACTAVVLAQATKPGSVPLPAGALKPAVRLPTAVTTTVPPPASLPVRTAKFNALVAQRARDAANVRKLVAPAGARPLPLAKLPLTTLPQAKLPPARGVASPPSSAANAPYHVRMGYGRVHSGGLDCDDNRRGVHPNASEVCDHLDNNCDGAVDEGQTFVLYLDADGDTHGDPTRRVEACPADQHAAAADGSWLVPVGNDCDDADPTRWRECAR